MANFPCPSGFISTRDYISVMHMVRGYVKYPQTPLSSARSPLSTQVDAYRK